jgi:hypothetical protein
MAPSHSFHDMAVRSVSALIASGTSNWKPPFLMLVPTVSKTFFFEESLGACIQSLKIQGF